MFKLRWLFLCSCILLFPLAACDGFPSSGSTSPGGSSSTNTSPGTQTSGPVKILTDHSDYQPTEQVRVTVQNTLSTPIYALDTRASCSILDLQIQINGRWQTASAARCSLGRPARQVMIQPGGAYTATIQANTPGLDTATFPAGTYRVLLSYSTVPSTTSQPSTTAVPSASFTVS